ncbi:c-type cytochrome [Thiotrichales bacterium HSG1]|nr:c-type cytochrome [Thiotrichales bacterium HSG1]
MYKLITTIILIGFSCVAMAESSDTVKSDNADGAALFKSKTCWSCHGKDAKTPLLPAYPKIAGQNKDYALVQMKDIKSGVRSNGQSAGMKGIMMLVNDEEMEIIAEWLSTLD